MKICKATKKDISIIAAIMIEVFSKTPWNEKWNKKNAVKVINNYYKIAEIYLALIEKKIVAFIIIREEPSNLGPWINIEELAIKQEFQKKGISKQLINYIENISKKRKAKKKLQNILWYGVIIIMIFAVLQLIGPCVDSFLGG